MERFLKFKRDVDLATLQNAVHNSGVIILRKSQTTDTIQIRVPEGMANREIRKIFAPFEIEKIYNEFPYPIHEPGIFRFIPWPLSRLLMR